MPPTIFSRSNTEYKTIDDVILGMLHTTFYHQCKTREEMDNFFEHFLPSEITDEIELGAHFAEELDWTVNRMFIDLRVPPCLRTPIYLMVGWSSIYQKLTDWKKRYQEGLRLE